jgi:hypothetical protein
MSLLWATYYPTLKFLFINYIVLDRQYAEQIKSKGGKALIIHSAVRLLLDNLRKKTKFPKKIKGIVAELLREQHNDQLRMLFSWYASSCQRRIYQLDIKYMQPSLDIDNLNAEIEEDLIFVPGDDYQRTIDYNGSRLAKHQAIEILRFVYLHVYADAFKLSGLAYHTYFDHMNSIVLKYEHDLGAEIRLHPLRIRRPRPDRSAGGSPILLPKPC